MLSKHDEFWNSPQVTQSRSARVFSSTMLDNTFTVLYEITINIPLQDSVLNSINVYKNVWAHLKTLYKPIAEQYFIEYCKSGSPHIHGYMEIKYPCSTLLMMS